jgi:hypothetical protein
MTSPSPADLVLVRPGALAALAGELTGLATELSDDADRCRAAARSLATALDGEEGWSAAAAGSGWAELGEVLARRTAALAQVVDGAVRAYLDEDARRAGWIDRRGEQPR